ncbi:MAG TPA: hypothetical protein VGN14_19390 [Candidatus Elarobacter sp.]|jgi:hypothetical protein
MTFDQWIDSVNDQVHGRLGSRVRTTELSWDSAMWVGQSGTVVAALQDNERDVTVEFDGGEKLVLNYADLLPESVASRIAAKL